MPASPTLAAVTSTSGAFNITVPAIGTYMLTIAKDTTYAALHRTITVSASGAALGTVRIAALTPDEQSWVVDINDQRSIVSNPLSFSNLVVDEYAEEQARAEVAAIIAGTDPYGDATESLFDNAYVASPGAMYGAGSVADLIGSATAYLSADAAWMSEKANCANGNWQTCAFAANTGHYINMSSTGDVWVGVGESTSSFNDPPYGNEWAYAVIFPTNQQGLLPASMIRTTAALPPK